jgi:hypothetical protein
MRCLSTQTETRKRTTLRDKKVLEDVVGKEGGASGGRQGVQHRPHPDVPSARAGLLIVSSEKQD